MSGHGYMRATLDFVADEAAFRANHASSFHCPLCLRETHPDNVTKDEFPPDSLGGFEWVPTCKSCNNVAGSTFESAASRFRDRAEFVRATGRFPDILYVDGMSHRVAVDKTCDPAFASPRDGTDSFAPRIAAATRDASGVNSRGLLQPDPRYSYDQKLLELTFVKAAYLALFDRLGYRAIATRAYEPTRAMIHSQGRYNSPVSVTCWPRRDPSRHVSLSVIVTPVGARSLLVGFHGFKTYRINGSEVEDVDVRVLMPLPSDASLERYRVAIGTIADISQYLLADLPADLRVRDGVPLELECDDGEIIRLNGDEHYANTLTVQEGKQT